MKKLNKVLSLVLALVMIMSLATTAFAASTTEHTITINNETKGYTYAAYQIFKGDLVDNELQNIEWGDSISDTTALMTALNDNAAFADCKDVVDVATVLGAISTDDHETTKAFADIVAGYLKTTAAGTSTYDETNKKYTIPVTGDGYYLVQNTAVPTDAAYTCYILEVVGNVSVDHKGTVPEVTKKIVEGQTKSDAADSEIGKTINYEFTGTMPSNIADYDTYYYVFTDTMSKGLTYTNNLKVTVNGKDVTKYFYANATTDATSGKTTLVVGMQDILALELIADLDTKTDGNQTVGDITVSTNVVVTYTAMLNEDAVVGVEGNPNDVKLDYSNNPNDDGEGGTTPPPENPNKPTPPTVHGETPKDTNIVYTTKIKLTKVDALDNTKTLTGAKFSISGISSNVKIINEQMYVPYGETETAVVNNVWYRLKDGTYTQTAPVFTDSNPDDDTNPITAGSYDNVNEAGDAVTTTYKKITEVTTETVTAPFAAEGWVKFDGTLTFTGLGEGTYTITELVAPDGYNLLEKAITVVIDSNVETITVTTGEEKVTWTAKDGTGTDAESWTVTTDGVIEIGVENTSGSTLPSTGGMGTTLFYVFGTIMVLGAAVILVTKKRMAE